jgi:hypothetical protein
LDPGSLQDLLRHLTTAACRRKANYLKDHPLVSSTKHDLSFCHKCSLSGDPVLRELAYLTGTCYIEAYPLVSSMKDNPSFRQKCSLSDNPVLRELSSLCEEGRTRPSAETFQHPGAFISFYHFLLGGFLLIPLIALFRACRDVCWDIQMARSRRSFGRKRKLAARALGRHKLSSYELAVVASVASTRELDLLAHADPKAVRRCLRGISSNPLEYQILDLLWSGEERRNFLIFLSEDDF